MYTVCFVEDEKDFAAEVAEYLSRHGFTVDHRDNLRDAVAWIKHAQPDLVVLDQFIGSDDALSIIPTLREQQFQGGIVVLTNNVSSFDKVVALECGADDFVGKADDFRVVLARLRAVLRRYKVERLQKDDGVVANAGDRLGAWEIDPLRGVLKAPDGNVIRLTNAEFLTLQYLENHAGMLVTREEISKALNNRALSPFDRTVDNVLSRLRRALETYKGPVPDIRPIRGKGYMFTGLNREPDPAPEPELGQIVPMDARADETSGTTVS